MLVEDTQSSMLKLALKGLRVHDLKEICLKCGLDVSGRPKKQELIDRLMNAKPANLEELVQDRVKLLDQVKMQARPKPKAKALSLSAGSEAQPPA
jgi:hypothetical protein